MGMCSCMYTYLLCTTSSSIQYVTGQLTISLNIKYYPFSVSLANVGGPTFTIETPEEQYLCSKMTMFTARVVYLLPKLFINVIICLTIKNRKGNCNRWAIDFLHTKKRFTLPDIDFQ